MIDVDTLETVLELFKFDLGIRHNLKDNDYKRLIKASVGELKRMGLELDFSNTDDLILLSDHTAWTYRKRQEDVPLSKNIKARIFDRKIEKAGKGSEDNASD